VDTREPIRPSTGELDEWRSQRDPIRIYRERMLEAGIDSDTLADIEREVREAIDRATEVCKAAPVPSADLLMKDVFADGGSAWRN
jgi:acetoin:2,6-dichlorophenolindophenol oxidoreductase subunit alpha